MNALLVFYFNIVEIFFDLGGAAQVDVCFGHRATLRVVGILQPASDLLDDLLFAGAGAAAAVIFAIDTHIISANNKPKPYINLKYCIYKC